MQITAQNLPLNKISATTLPGQNGQPARSGFSLFGMWLNGSDAFKTPQELQNHLLGKEVLLTKSKRSLFVGDPNWTPMEIDFAGLKSIITPKSVVSLNWSELDDLI